ncbi:hypothetical protein P0R31_34050 [Bradyrhizobium yuanmingense]|uniref:hypothetical protein n=1 Tax=Bradyrhizobium yuanmingense TaxID=108015 RepID=UPI0023B89DD8|nr:hypothetical protein [Bradyrhizobium yuanmingense]MDF0522265.1 hypothetical protein [Bradyrhizobium yuanmingense]
MGFDGDQVFVASSWNKAHFMEMKQNSGGKRPHIGDPQLGGIVSSKISIAEPTGRSVTVD